MFYLLYAVSILIISINNVVIICLSNNIQKVYYNLSELL